MPEKLGQGVLSWASMLDEKAREQALQTATIGAINGHVALMPDAHWGMGCTIGSVIPTQAAIIPSAVGVDIGCVDADTEYLSPQGWRRIADYDGGPVMQYEPDSGLGMFVEPEHFVRLPCDEFWYFRTKYGIDQMLSDEHRMLVWRITGRDRRRVPEVVDAATLAAEHDRLVLGARVEFETTFTPKLDTELLLSDAQLRVQMMVNADGHLDMRNPNNPRAQLVFRKQRKITRARKLLIEAGIPYTENEGRSCTTFRFGPPLASKGYGSFWGASSTQLQVLADEVLHWDGNLDDRVFFTADREAADFVHYAFTAVGYRAVLRVDDRDRGHQPEYRVFAHEGTKVGLAGVPKTPVGRVPSPDGYKYCFTVSSGFWVMRRSGNVAMTGNCGVIATETSLRAEQLPDDLTPILDKWEREIPAGLGYWHANDDPMWQDFVREHGMPEAVTSDQRLRDRAPKQFGTLGSGNHFLELCTDEEDYVWLMLHSGSRGTGNKLAMRHIESAKDLMKRYFIELPDPDLAYLVEGTPEFDAYISDLLWAQAYAFGSRQRMMNVALDALLEIQSEIGIGANINNHHNYARMEHHHGKNMWITRKGAISAREGELGVIPGSMGTGSYIVRGLGNPASYTSASHGAGRAMSRTQARKQFTQDDIEAAMEGRTWLAKDAKALIDEIPGAYKDLDVVMADQVDLVETVHRLTTVINYKGIDSQHGGKV